MQDPGEPRCPQISGTCHPDPSHPAHSGAGSQLTGAAQQPGQAGLSYIKA